MGGEGRRGQREAAKSVDKSALLEVRKVLRLKEILGNSLDPFSGS